METLLVRVGNHCHVNKPYRSSLAVFGARAAKQSPSHVWHQGRAKAARCQPGHRCRVRLNTQPCNVTAGLCLMQREKGSSVQPGHTGERGAAC